MRIVQPRIPNQLEKTEFSRIFEDDYTELHLVEVTNARFTEDVLHDMRLGQTVVKNSHFANTDFTGIDLSDVRFENCDFSNADLSNASMIRVEFVDCKLLGINLSESYIGQTGFHCCIINLGIFAQTKFENVLFEESILENADFFDCTFKKLGFDTCHINDVNFRETSLKGIDISSSEFETIGVSMEHLKGCIVSRHQAAYFAGLLGIQIKD